MAKKEEKKEVEEGFKYIVRIADTDIDGERSVVYGLTQIKGIGHRVATFIADKVNLPREEKIGRLSDEKIDEIKEIIANLPKHAPPWLLNHRHDFDTGEDIHLVSTEVDVRVKDDINLMKKIRCYKGIRHEQGQKVRGQRTRSNGRTGLTLGVSRKRS